MDRPALDAPASEWLVYGDALQEAGDPRGELISLAHAVAEGRADAAARDAHVRKHWKALLGKCPPHTRAYDLDWHYCTLRAATVRFRHGDPDPLAPLLAAPIASELRSITLCGVIEDYHQVDLSPHMRLLATRAPATCRSFAFTDARAVRPSTPVTNGLEFSPSLVGFGPLAPFWPRATELALDVGSYACVELGEIDAPDLRSFALRSLSYSLGDTALRRLAEARWPRLESFELRLVEQWVTNEPEPDPYEADYSSRDPEDGDEAPDEGEPSGANWGALVPMLRTLAACPLRRLALTSFHSSRSLLEALASAGLPASLEELDLTDGAVGDADAEWLLAHGDRFRSLRRLVLEHTSMSGAAAERLRALGPEILHSTGNAPRYRYVVSME